jgi:predicted NBD/HSP70 family sugar kinase
LRIGIDLGGTKIEAIAIGCIETFLSGPGLSEDHMRKTGERLSSNEIARAAADGDGRVQATLERDESRLARGLASVVNVVDPLVIVLGGGLSNVDSLYDRVAKLWGKYVFLRSRRHASRAPVTATQAACAARRGSGKKGAE